MINRAAANDGLAENGPAYAAGLVGQAFRFTWAMTRLTLDTLGQLVTGRLSPKTLSGPIGIARASAQAAHDGPFEFFRLLAFISLQVGLLNVVLPLVPFDGGHLALLVLESAMRRDLSERARNWVMNAPRSRARPPWPCGTRSRPRSSASGGRP